MSKSKLVTLVAILALSSACSAGEDHGTTADAFAQGMTAPADVALFYPFPLAPLTTSLSHRPDYDALIEVNVATATAGKSFITAGYSNSKGYHSLITMNLETGAIRFEEGVMRGRSAQDLAAPTANASASAEYLSSLNTLRVQVTAARNGNGSLSPAHPELANAVSYLEAVFAKLTNATKIAESSLYFPMDLNTIASPIELRPDFDSKIVLSLSNEQGATKVRGYTDNSKGFHAEILWDLSTGVLTMEEGQMGSSVKNTAAPTSPTAPVPAEYASLLRKLQGQVMAIRDGKGVQAVKHPELANLASYIEAVLALH
jgi:hypothetical protein